MAGDFSVPANDVTAVVLSVATANSKGPGHFTLFPAGATQPTAANLNYATGQVVPNLVEVGVGAGGAVSLYSSAASDAIVDLEGYVTTDPQGRGRPLQRPSTPARICDTRGSNPSGLTGGATQCNTNTAHGSPDNLIGPNNPLTINVEGNGGVPASGVSAVVLNVAVAKAGAAGFVTVYPTGDARPGASNVNYTAGVAVGNRVIVPVSPSGQVTLYATAATDIIVDVSGWFTASGGTTGAEFTPEVDPVRICDTRGSNPSGLVAPYTQCNTNTAHPSPDHPLVAGTSDLIQATGLADVPTGATAAVLNLADVNPSAGSNLTVYPSGTPPTTSDVNPPTGGVASNLAVATLTTSGSFEVANRGSGHTDIVIDVAGWYTTPVTNPRDLNTQSNLNTALLNAKAEYQQNQQSYPTTTTMVTDLNAAEPRLSFTAGPSTDPSTISVMTSTDGNGIVLAAYNGINTCWYVVDNPSAPTQTSDPPWTGTATANGTIGTGQSLVVPSTPGSHYAEVQGDSTTADCSAGSPVIGPGATYEVSTTGFPA